MTSSPLDGRYILVVEDDYMIAQEVRDDVERAGATVVGPVPSVAKAMRLIEQAAAIDAAVLDVNLDGENSFPIAEALEVRGIPFLFSTGYNSADIRAAWRHATIVMKPLRITAVEQLLLGGDAV